jgi:hypothetical protein
LWPGRIVSPIEPHARGSGLLRCVRCPRWHTQCVTSCQAEECPLGSAMQIRSRHEKQD